MSELTRENLLDNFALEAIKILMAKRDNDSRDADRLASHAYFIAERMLERRKMILSEWELDKKVVQKSNEEIERDSINNLYLTRRSENCLKAEGIFTITQLLNRTANSLLKIPNLGRKSQKEIIEQLAGLDYKLRDQT